MRSARRSFVRHALAAAAPVVLSTIAACAGAPGPSSQDVGAPCSADSQCEKRCFKSADFGDGMCSMSCRVDQDCPTGAVCLQTGGGVCAVACTVPADCSGFGPTWTCASEDHAGTGQALVCRVSQAP